MKPKDVFQLRTGVDKAQPISAGPILSCEFRGPSPIIPCYSEIKHGKTH